MKTILKLKRNDAAIVFTDKGCQLIYPERPEGEVLPQHFSLAGAVVLALQYEVFIDSMFAFLKDQTEREKAIGKEMTH